MRPGRRGCGALALALALMAGGLPVHAQRAVTIVVPTPPGGPIDRVARVVAQYLQPRLDAPVVVENRQGAAGKIGAQAALRAPRDGQTLLAVSPSILTVNPVVDRAVGYDPLKDFTPLAIVAANSGVLAVRAGLPVADLAGLVDFAKAHPDGLTYASFGVGTSLHLQSEELLQTLGITARHVPYKGEAQAMNALVAGEVDMMVYVTAPIVPYVQSGRVRALAATGARRWELLPGVPTYAESGLPALRGYTYRSWVGLAMPAGAPAAQQDAVGRALRDAMAEPGLRLALEGQGFEPQAYDPAAMREAISSELDRNRRVAASGRVHLD
ncbi:MAG: tripartite tricarboxylate transporter substrate binding protein [Alcaligenaceae bacterium]|nr:tripartite tricarboxylate transporter substrate binding protein [Alcaligenaceae bacterium SAGV5]MPS51938.1 tripartite tricarboxylate transporter substrate binding protein [Alcaligenaceae bacterium SAGV3]MPT58415.1 tripartite tricarboxylate transporter substrate binding protein [Alcaligenaceae bacterium]